MGGELGLDKGLGDGGELLMRDGRRGDGSNEGDTSTLGEEVGDPEGDLLGDTVGGELGLDKGLGDGGELLMRDGRGDGSEEGRSQSHSPMQMFTSALSWPRLIHSTSTEAAF